MNAATTGTTKAMAAAADLYEAMLDGMTDETEGAWLDAAEALTEAEKIAIHAVLDARLDARAARKAVAQ